MPENEPPLIPRPLNFRAKDGTMMGLEVDLAKTLASLMGAELKIVQKPFGQLLGALQKGAYAERSLYRYKNRYIWPLGFAVLALFAAGVAWERRGELSI